jgi:hemerythrin
MSTDGSYDNRHRAFLQALFGRQTITFEDSKPLISAIESAHSPERPTLPEDVSQDVLEDYIDRVNDAISPFDLEIRNTLHQTQRTRIYALVNTTSDALTQMATVHSADEIAYVKRVLDAMFETHNTQRAEIMATTGMQALELAKLPHDRRESNALTQAAQNAALTKSQAENMLESMVAEGWFELSQRGYYSLTPRALMELKDWLVRTYNDQAAESDEEDDEPPRMRLKFCEACRDIVTVGQRCPSAPCNARLHDDCVGKIFRAQHGQQTCPSCKTDWKDVGFVGERAARSGRTSTVGADRRRSTVNHNHVESGRDDDDESDD